jgi:hypothetical protein
MTVVSGNAPTSDADRLISPVLPFTLVTGILILVIYPLSFSNSLTLVGISDTSAFAFHADFSISVTIL